MTYQQLLHAIRAACTVANETELYVFGSQSILAHLDQLPEELTQSIEVDISPISNTENVVTIDGVLGECLRTFFTMLFNVSERCLKYF